MERKKIVAKIDELATAVAADLGMELVGVELKTSRGGYHVIVFIDKPGGVNLDDCEQVSKALGELMDLHDPIPSRYMLEVSSPGIERPLKKKDDFIRFLGKEAKIKTAKTINGSKTFSGTLGGVQDDTLLLRMDKGEIEIPIHDIVKANLCYKKGGGKK